MKLNLKWKTKVGQFTSGKSLWIGNIRLGEYGWNISRSRNDKGNSYVGGIDLPGIIKNRFYSDSTRELEAQLEQAVKTWFDEALAERKDK